MKRKVIQIAGSTQLVSLPREWAKQHGVNKGDELEVEADGKRVIITTSKDAVTAKCAEMDLTPYAPVAQRILHALYKVGYDELVLRYSNPEVFETVCRMLRDETIGYEIVEQRPNQCTIRAIAGIVEAEFEPLLRRTFLLLKSMFEGIFEAIDKGDRKMFLHLRAMESTNNKYTGFCRRLLNKKGAEELKKTTVLYAAIEELEKIADECKYLCDYVTELKKIEWPDKKTRELFKEVVSLMQGCYDVFYNYAPEKLVALFQKRKDILEKTLPLLDEPARRGRFLHHIAVMAQKLANVLSFKMELSL